MRTKTLNSIDPLPLHEGGKKMKFKIGDTVKFFPSEDVEPDFSVVGTIVDIQTSRSGHRLIVEDSDGRLWYAYDYRGNVERIPKLQNNPNSVKENSAQHKHTLEFVGTGNPANGKSVFVYRCTKCGKYFKM